MEKEAELYQLDKQRNKKLDRFFEIAVNLQNKKEVNRNR